jgi:hypothetical protein
MFGAVGRNLGVYVFRLEPTLTSIAVPEFDGFPPLGAAQAALNGVTHQLFRGNFFLRSGFLDLLDQLARQPYIFRCHTLIVLLLLQNITRLPIVNVSNFLLQVEYCSL